MIDCCVGGNMIEKRFNINHNNNLEQIITAYQIVLHTYINSNTISILAYLHNQQQVTIKADIDANTTVGYLLNQNRLSIAAGNNDDHVENDDSIIFRFGTARKNVNRGLCLNVQHAGDEYECLFTYPESKWDPDTANGFIDCYSTVLSCLNDTQAKVTSVNLLSESARVGLMAILKGPVNESGHNLMFHEFVERAADEHPDAVALKMLDDEMTYKEFDERANQVANYLISKGIQVEDCIGVLFPRGFDQMVAVFGILKAGATYIPLDIAYPDERVRSIVDACHMRYCLAYDKVYDICIKLDSLDSNILAKTRVMNTDVCLENVAYILFTSGSTGKPKGVQIEHKSIANLEHYCASQCPDSLVRTLCTARLSWDVSVLGMLVSFSKGNTLCVIPPNLSQNLPQYLNQVCEDMRVDLLIGT
eukprot:CAMPEP_0203765150 /NCGR_PEP_ID=MMETSP0098-20131031/18257_1 /ASSEMBLY_ACC=CAM_ASM_000208 /TAXON_ID=96639 /ORGANISM=" , Strain NY0313808BC1" /LENGTH=418 /DNA_ID=CAMNT_0050661377 /DNA_START=681 /DNA_END=1934 /DNA_ORIENTATION=-